MSYNYCDHPTTYSNLFLRSDRLLDKVRERLAQTERYRKAPNRAINFVDLGVDLEDPYIEQEWYRYGTRAGKIGLFNFTLHGILTMFFYLLLRRGVLESLQAAAFE